MPKPNGPHLLTLEPGRPVYYALPGDDSPAPRPWRLVAHIHGICGPPSYACGKWIGAGAEVGALVCPTGNARCGDPSIGPASWEAPSWAELLSDMDHDLERSIALVQKKHPHAVRREGAILTGYSRGGFAVPFLAARHPGVWPYLLVIEADATFTAAGLHHAGVRRLALVGGELGTEIAGMQRTADALVADGFPARLFVMPKTGHLYSDNMEDVMRAALAFLLADGNDASP